MGSNSLTRTDIGKLIRGWEKEGNGDPHGRFRSWEHCYRFFREKKRAGIANQKELAALHLAFFLASWGMYRGSTFILQRAYTVHIGAVEVLTDRRFSELWEKEVGSEDANSEATVSLIMDAMQGIREAYKNFGSPTDTLVTKVLLGTLGCVPACDRYFLIGLKRTNIGFSGAKRRFVERVLEFCTANLDALRKEQARIEASGEHYPLMKLVDMYFNQLGHVID